MKKIKGILPCMHEFGVALEILKTCRETAAEYRDAKISSVKIRVGELTAIEPDLLKSAWEAAVADQAEEGARLEVEWRQARQFCAECQAEKSRTQGSWLRLCPDCGMPLLVEGGDDLDVLQIEILTEDDDE